MEQQAPSIVKPALIGGAIFGFLAGVPFIDLANCACCALILGAGFLAGALHSRQLTAAGLPFDAAAGAKVGFLAGVIYGIVDTIFSTISDLLFQEAVGEWVVDLLQEIPDVPSEVIDDISHGMESGLWASFLWNLLFGLGLGMIFATIGGLIASSAFRRGESESPPRPSSEGGI